MTTDNKTEIESVIRKIKKALALANDKNNAQESDTAMLLAQKLMAKHNLTMSNIEIENTKTKEVIEGDGTEFTRLQWWMKILASIISDNFKCYNYIRHKGGRTKIIFFGLEEDVEICKVIYDFALCSVKFHSDQYVKSRGISGNRGTTIAIKNDYIAGYIQGLKDKFKEQVKQNDWGLILVKDKEVVERYNKIPLSKGRPITNTSHGDSEAKAKGYIDGKNFSHSNKAIETR